MPWSLLRNLHSCLSYLWICFGDYNEILELEEKQGRTPKTLRLMQEFCGTLLHYGLIDLGYHENIFTWNNGRVSDDFVQARLDRASANIGWRDLFPYGRVTHI